MSWQLGVILGNAILPLSLIAVAFLFSNEHKYLKILLVGFGIAGLLSMPATVFHVIDSSAINITQSTNVTNSISLIQLNVINGTQATHLKEIERGNMFIYNWLPYLLLFYFIFYIIIVAVKTFKERKKSKEEQGE